MRTVRHAFATYAEATAFAIGVAWVNDSDLTLEGVTELAWTTEVEVTDASGDDINLFIDHRGETWDGPPAPSEEI